MQNLAVQEQSTEDGEQQLTFSATGSEYFRILIVNVLLTIVTLGIYSAWAKVRSNQYFYSSARLAGSSFEYHGNPKAILKGRIAALILVGGYQAAVRTSITAALVMAAVMACVMPYLVWKSLQFKLHNTSYRGIRFGFDGSIGKAYLYYLLMPLLAATVVMLPWVHQRIKKFQHTESRFGAAHFSFDAPVGRFYAIYGKMLAAYIVGIIAITVFGVVAAIGSHAGAMIMIPIFVYIVMFAVYPLFFTMFQKLVWNHTQLGNHWFRCNMNWKSLTWIYFTNLLGMVVTLGLYTPFAKVRALKYRLESMYLDVNGSLDDFVAGEHANVGAAGEGMADFMDFDLSL